MRWSSASADGLSVAQGESSASSATDPAKPTGGCHVRVISAGTQRWAVARSGTLGANRVWSMHARACIVKL